jgi:hypothetical protein
MHVEGVIATVQLALTNSAALGAGDPAVEAASAQLVEALGPVLRQAAFELAEQAAAEVGAQLPDRKVDVVLSDGEPSLRIGESNPSFPPPTPEEEESDARITLRLAPTLKRLVEEAASAAGASVNGWVVDALNKRARQSGTSRPSRVKGTIDL